MWKRYEENSLSAVVASRTCISAASQPKSIQATCFKLCSCVSSEAIDHLVRRDDDLGFCHLSAVCQLPAMIILNRTCRAKGKIANQKPLRTLTRTTQGITRNTEYKYWYNNTEYWYRLVACQVPMCLFGSLVSTEKPQSVSTVNPWESSVVAESCLLQGWAIPCHSLDATLGRPVWSLNNRWNPLDHTRYSRGTVCF